MTIAEFHDQCCFDSLPQGDGYLIVATHRPTGMTVPIFSKSAGDTHATAVALLRLVSNSQIANVQ